jgi:hypothetical protein
MKYLIYIGIFSNIFSLKSIASPTDWDKWLSARESKLEEVLKLPQEERIFELGGLLRSSAFEDSEWVAGIIITSDDKYLKNKFYLYKKLQPLLLGIPGHAEFHAKPVWESYAAYRDPDHPKHEGSLTWFSEEMRYGFQTLKHLPSPETVKALGGMLREEWEDEPDPNSEVHPAQSMAKYAVTAMTLLNIREAPSEPIQQYDAPKVLAGWQDWYEQVKSGQRTFSFKGQPVEYRFKPDGTWETTPIANPPDDAPEVPEARPADRRPVTQETKEQPPGNAGKSYRSFLLAALAALLALAAAWFGMRRMKARV